MELSNGGSEMGRRHITKINKLGCRKWSRKPLKILTLIYLFILVVSQLTTPTVALFHDEIMIEGTLSAEKKFNDDIKKSEDREEAYQDYEQSSDDQKSAEVFDHNEINQEEDAMEVTSDMYDSITGQTVQELTETAEVAEQSPGLDNQNKAELESKQKLEEQTGADQADIDLEDRSDGENEREDHS